MVTAQNASRISRSYDRCGDFGVWVKWGMVTSGVEFDCAVLELVQYPLTDVNLPRLYRAAPQAKGRTPAKRRTGRRLLERGNQLALNS